jgi:hypothetical protein
MRHFEEALKTVQASVTENDLARYESLKKEMNRRKANHGNVSLYG